MHNILFHGERGLGQTRAMLNFAIELSRSSKILFLFHKSDTYNVHEEIDKTMDILQSLDVSRHLVSSNICCRSVERTPSFTSLAKEIGDLVNQMHDSSSEEKVHLFVFNYHGFQKGGMSATLNVWFDLLRKSSSGIGNIVLNVSKIISEEPMADGSNADITFYVDRNAHHQTINGLTYGAIKCTRNIPNVIEYEEWNEFVYENSAVMMQLARKRRPHTGLYITECQLDKISDCMFMEISYDMRDIFSSGADNKTMIICFTDEDIKQISLNLRNVYNLCPENIEIINLFDINPSMNFYSVEQCVGFILDNIGIRGISNLVLYGIGQLKDYPKFRFGKSTTKFPNSSDVVDSFIGGLKLDERGCALSSFVMVVQKQNFFRNTEDFYSTFHKFDIIKEQFDVNAELGDSEVPRSITLKNVDKFNSFGDATYIDTLF